MRQCLIDPDFFAANRQKFVRSMKTRALAIFHSNDHMPRSGDQHYPYRQQSDFFYLTGISQPNSVLVLFPKASNPKMEAILFIEKTSKKHSIWEGEKLDKEGAIKISGIDTIHWLEQYESILHDLVAQCDRLYVNGNESAAANQAVISKDMRMAKEVMEKYPFHKYHRSQPILRKIRMRKSASEIKFMREAIRITKIAFENIIRDHGWI